MVLLGGKILTLKYPGKRWSSGTILLLLYWLLMLGMLTNAGVYYYDRTEGLVELH